MENGRSASAPVIAYADFARVDVRAGTIVSAAPLAGARNAAFVLEIDLGPAIGVKTSTAQITARYTPASLVGRQVAAVVNLAPKRVAGVTSDVLVLGFAEAAGDVVLVCPTAPVPDGARLY